MMQRRCQVLILSPTRELANQTEKVIMAVGDYMNVQAHACIGGKSLGKASLLRDRSMPRLHGCGHASLASLLIICMHIPLHALSNPVKPAFRRGHP